MQKLRQKFQCPCNNSGNQGISAHHDRQNAGALKNIAVKKHRYAVQGLFGSD